ncbi:MAG: RDD family protein [Armatimonadota bacterium]
MPRQITITTPENVAIEYELAGLGTRGGAAVLDLAIQGVLVSAVAATRFFLAPRGQWPGATWPTALLGIVLFVIVYGYYVYFETVWNGQTPGKRWAKLRTVQEGGRPVDFACAALRNLVRVVDFLPVMYGLGALVTMASPRNKRLGDYAAGTLVVKERRVSPGESAPRIERLHSPGLVRNIELVTPEEFAAAKRFVERKAELRPEVREELARKIAQPLAERLAALPEGSFTWSAFLDELVARCIEERGMR